MSPQTIAAIAALIAEAVNAGTSIAEIFDEVKANDRVSPETWAKIKAEVEQAEAFWTD